MGRRRNTPRLKYDDWDNKFIIASPKNDRATASKAKDARDLQRIARGNGAIADELWTKRLIDFAPDGKIQINRQATSEHAKSFAKATVDERFYGRDEQQRRIQDIVQEHGISYKKAENLYERQGRDEAIAILAAARVGGVKIDPHDKGILNKVAQGKFYDVVWGEEDSSGRRKYEKGTWKSKVGGGRGDNGLFSKDANAREKARALYETRYGDPDKMRVHNGRISQRL
jgi:hypothetical protein